MIKLTDAEWEVMKVLWDRGELPLSKIVDQLHKNKITWVPNTVHTLITRLVKKNAVHKDSGKNPFQYYAMVERDYCEQNQLREFADKVFNGSLSKLVSTFLAAENVSKEELEVLREIISKMGEDT